MNWDMKRVTSSEGMHSLKAGLQLVGGRFFCRKERNLMYETHSDPVQVDQGEECAESTKSCSGIEK